MYSDPYQRAGRLAMDLFLSSRLVLDTGMNALGWSREKGVAFMREHTFESDLQIDTETLRYSVRLSRAGARLQVRARGSSTSCVPARRRRSARRFDLPAFHAYLLRAGSMPLSVLDGHVECFIQERHRAR